MNKVGRKCMIKIRGVFFLLFTHDAVTIDRHGEPMERRLIQFAFPGKEEGNRSRKIIFQGEKKKKEKGKLYSKSYRIYSVRAD